MNAIKLIGAALLVLGVLGLVYGGFSYTKETHDVDLGPVEFQLKEKERVNVPMWAGAAAALAGGGLLLFGGRKSG